MGTKGHGACNLLRESSWAALRKWGLEDKPGAGSPRLDGGGERRLWGRKNSMGTGPRHWPEARAKQPRAGEANQLRVRSQTG